MMMMDAGAHLASDASSKPRDDYLWLCLLALPGLVCLAGGFVWTDHAEIVQGGMVASSWRELFTETLGGIPNAYHRPLVYWLHTLTVWAFGADPLVFRLSNYVLHVGNVLLGYSLARAVSVPRAPALAAFALFAVHPVVATPIAWAGDRTDSLALMGATACLLSFVAFLKHGRRVLAVAACGFLLLGLSAKEVTAGAVLVAASALLDTGSRRRALPCWVGLVAVTGGWFAWRAALSNESVARARSWSLPERIATAMQIHWDYAIELVLPSRLRACDGAMVPSNHLLPIGLGLVLVVATAWVAWRWRRQQRTWQLLALAWLVAFLIPTSGIISLRHIRADRYLYCALPAALLLAVAALEFTSWRRRAVMVAACYLYFVTGLTSRSLAWRTEDALWEREVRLDAGCREGWARLGTLASFRKDHVTSAAHYEKALSQEPNVIAFTPRADILHNLAVSYINLGRFELARERLREALHVAGSESAIAGPILYQWAASHVAERNCGEALPLLERVRAMQVTPSLASDNDRLLRTCAAGQGRERELLLHPQVGLRQLDWAQLDAARRGPADTHLKAPNEWAH